MAILVPAAAYTQSVRGLVSGVVRDADRKPLAGAAVVLVQSETDRRRNASTDAAGEFTISNLPPGDYQIEVANEGYQKQARRFTLPLDHEIWIEIQLLPGQRRGTIQVSAVREPLRAQSSALGGLTRLVVITMLFVLGSGSSARAVTTLVM